MHLPGRLDSTTLGDVLGTLYRGSATGVLELSEPGRGPRSPRTHRIQLLSGLVAGVETDLSVLPIGELLARSGKLDRRAIDVMLYRMAIGDPRPAGSILVGMGAVSADTLISVLRTQVRVRLDAVYNNLGEARLAFRTSRPLPKDALRIGPLMPREFLYGRPRKRDKIESARQSPRPSAREPEPPSSGRRSPWWATREWGLPDEKQDSPPPASGPRARSNPDPQSQLPKGPRGKALRTLGLQTDADEATIRRAFKKLAVELHPDRHSTAPEAIRNRHAARFAEASAAFHLLVA